MNFSTIRGANETLTQLYPVREAIHDRILLLTKRLRSSLCSIPNVIVKSFDQTSSGITLFTGRGREKSYYDDLQITVNHRSDIRVSPHFYNTEEEIDRFLNMTEATV